MKARALPRTFLAWLALALLTIACGANDTPAPYDYCDGKAPDAACYAAKRAPGSTEVALARAIADKQLELHPADQLAWNWEEAVMMFALAELYRVTGESAYLDYTRDWIDHHIAQGYLIETSDTASPALAALTLYIETGDDKYRLVVQDALTYLEQEALRTEEGGINHLGIHDEFGVTLWVDSLFMFGTLLTRWGGHQDDQPALDEYVNQFTIFTDLLQEDPGWYKHAYGWAGPQDPGVYWARGNGWITASGYDHLRLRVLRGEELPAIRQALERQVVAILASQTDTGLWWNNPSHPGEFYQETSASALFAYGMARAYRYGLLDDEVLPAIEAAMDGVQAMIELDAQGRPVVTGISGPTTVGTLEMYGQVPLTDDITYGLGAVILALSETSGLSE